jgi:hypothetical protein
MMASTYEQAQAILRCPITKQNLRMLTQQEVTRFNNRIATGELVHADGTLVKASLEAGFISKDGRFVTPVLDGIILFCARISIHTCLEPPF